MSKLIRSEHPEIDARYKIAHTKPSDIYQHVETLYQYATKCKSVVECGTRSCVSIWGLLKAMHENEGTLIGVDLHKSPNIDLLERIAATSKAKFTFLEQSDLTISIEPVDMVFIDTWHVYGQLKRELAKFGPLTRKYICMHDTTVDENVGESIREHLDINKQVKETGWSWIEIYAGLWPAVIEFLRENPEWKLEHRYTHCNGLTILSRI